MECKVLLCQHGFKIIMFLLRGHEKAAMSRTERLVVAANGTIIFPAIVAWFLITAFPFGDQLINNPVKSDFVSGDSHLLFTDDKTTHILSNHSLNKLHIHPLKRVLLSHIDDKA